MTYKEELKRLDTLLSDAFIAVRDNYGMPNSREVAEYLLKHGVEVHRMRAGSNCYMIDCCAAPSTADCLSECCDCKDCQYYNLHVVTMSYSPYFHDSEFGKTVFATKEEAEAELQAIKDGQVSAISVEYIDKLEDTIK